jgi:4'-phosphopantetheinyl transferase EntD
MTAAELELSAALGHRVTLRRATSPMDSGDLLGDERLQYHALSTPTRRRDWLLGRTALKALLTAATDTSGIVFPHSQLSITHADATAYAVRSSEGVLGTGVDFEPATRTPRARTARFFLHCSEIAPDLPAHQLLRLWTVKEALFKATADNEDTVLVDYRLDDAGVVAGAARGPRGELLRYASVVVPEGLLTVAVCHAEGACDVAV